MHVIVKWMKCFLCYFTVWLRYCEINYNYIVLYHCNKESKFYLSLLKVSMYKWESIIYLNVSKWEKYLVDTYTVNPSSFGYLQYVNCYIWNQTYENNIHVLPTMPCIEILLDLILVFSKLVFHDSWLNLVMVLPLRLFMSDL